MHSLVQHKPVKKSIADSLLSKPCNIHLQCGSLLTTDILLAMQTPLHDQDLSQVKLWFKEPLACRAS